MASYAFCRIKTTSHKSLVARDSSLFQDDFYISKYQKDSSKTLPFPFSKYYCKQEIGSPIVKALSPVSSAYALLFRTAEWASQAHFTYIDFNFAGLFLKHFSFQGLFSLTFFMLLVNLPSILNVTVQYSLKMLNDFIARQVF